MSQGPAQQGAVGLLDPDQDGHALGPQAGRTPGGQGRALFYIRLAPHPLLPEKLNGTLVPMWETARIARVNDLKGQGYRYLVRV